MTINGLEKLKKVELEQMQNVYPGEYFYFIDDSSTIYIKADNGIAINLLSGDTIDEDDSENINVPVKTLSVEINILEILNE